MSATSAFDKPESVAVIGIGCRFPGGITDARSFWRFLGARGDAIAEIPRDRFDLGHYYDEHPATPGRVMTRWGGFLENLEGFDAGFFGMSPREAERLDPQQRLLLETAWEALEDAGQDVEALEGSKTGVFVGQWLSDFEARLFADPELVDFYMTTGSGRYASSGRLSYLLGLRGPSLTLDTACSSSLVAVHMAARSIRNGESELALAGGVNVILQPHISVAYSQSRMMAPDGRCKFGDASGDGYVRSEGAGLVVLKSLTAARAAGDRIYAVIRGSAVNNDGRSSGSMGTPSRVGQEELLRQAYRDARVTPGEVGYIEAHGTGTRAGDPVELGALGAVLAEGRASETRARVGSVKTNFGHTEGAAGIAGLIKATLCLHHQAIPASLHCRQLNPTIPWDQLPVQIALQHEPWPADVRRRIAGVSAFGIAGTNAHVVLEGVDLEDQHTTGASDAPVMLPLSARSDEALRAVAAQYSALAADPDASVADICWNAAIRRSALEQRAVFVAPSRTALHEALETFAAGGNATAYGVRHGKGTRPKVAFVIPGQGAQWTGMARQLLARAPVFLDAMRACDVAAQPYMSWDGNASSLLEQLQLDPGDARYRLDRIDVIQPALVAMAIAYAKWLESVGVTPDAVIGHSMGEVGAAYLAGVLDLNQAMRIICRRSALMRETSGRGAMAMVELSMADAEARIGARRVSVSVAVSNSPTSTVISGDPVVVREILTECERDGVFCRLVKVDVASHSPQMDGPSTRLAAELVGLPHSTTAMPVYSTVLARVASGSEFDAAYWGRNMRQPVRFTDTVAKLLEDGITVFVELGPHPLLMPAVQQTAQHRGTSGVTAIACGRRDESEQATLLAAVGNLWAAGVRVDWKALLPRSAHLSLPTYPWQRERYWVRQAQARAPGNGAVVQTPELEDKHRAWLHCLRWQASEAASRRAIPVSPRPWVLVSADAVLASAVANALRNRGHQAITTTPQAIGQTLASLSATSPQGVVLLSPEATDAAFAPIVAIQACSRAFAGLAETAQPRLWLVTRGAQAVDQHPRPMAVEQAAAWGAGRVVAEDHPTLWGGMVDLDPDDSSAGELVDELLEPDGEDQIAWRAGKRYVLRVGALDEGQQASAPVSWRPDGAYLITGGLGGIGSLVATAMVARGARRLILLGRTPLPARSSWNEVAADSVIGQRIATVRALEKAGASVHLLVADMSDEADLERALNSYAGEAWPPIVGVVHAAGLLGSKLTVEMDRGTFDRVLLPKLAGAQNLDRLLPDLDVFILIGSTSAILGLSGMSNYAAANAGLDALAVARRARGVHALSIQWGPWLSTGMQAGEVAERNTAELERQGIQPIPAADGVALYEWLTGFPASTVMAMPVDWTTFRAARGGRNRRVFVDRMGDAETSGGAEDFAARLAAADSPHARLQMMESAVRDTAAQVLHVPPKRLDTRRPLGTMGLDSLMAIELRNRLEALLGRPLSATLAWNYPTVEALAAFLSKETIVAPPATVPVAIESASLEAGLEDILALSDEDVARALRGGGA